MATQTRNDVIKADLVSKGFTTGSLADGELARLRALNGTTTGSLADNYRIAGEVNRLAGEK